MDWGPEESAHMPDRKNIYLITSVGQAILVANTHKWPVLWSEALDIYCPTLCEHQGLSFCQNDTDDGKTACECWTEINVATQRRFFTSSSLVPSFEKGGYWFQRRVLRVLWHWWDRVMPSHSSDVYYWLTSGSRQGTSKAGHGWQLRYVLGSRGAMSLSKHACETLKCQALARGFIFNGESKEKIPGFMGRISDERKKTKHL